MSDKRIVALLFLVAVLFNYVDVTSFVSASNQITDRKSINEQNVGCLPVRAVMIHPRSKQQIEFYRKLISAASEKKFNTVFIEATGWINYHDLPKINLPNAFEPQDMSSLADYARSLGMEVIPSIWLLSHQDEVARRYHPELMLNNQTIDLINPKTWTFEKKLIDNTIKMFNAKRILIGHDEVRIAKKKAKENQYFASKTEDYVTPSQFIEHIKKIHDYLLKQSIETIIWGDMFLTPDMSGGAYPNDPEKPTPGYNGTIDLAELLNYIPKDIIIADWHYENKSTIYPSYDFFQKKGFRVWGASWHELNNIRTFSKYVRSRARDNEGMIATTWHFCDIKYEKYVLRIISESGDAFCRDEHGK
jgi:hypothetical protein